MSLTNTTPASATEDIWAIGSNTNKTLSFTKTAVFTGNVRFHMAIFAEPGLAYPSPESAYYEVAYPAVNGTTVEMAYFGGVRYHNYRVVLTRVSSTVFQITIYFLFTADTNEFQQQPESGKVTNVERLQKNNFSNPLQYNNTYPSVYSLDDRLIKYKCETIDDGESAIGEAGYTARFYNRGLLDAASEATWSYYLERDALVVTNLSAYDDTKIVWTVDSGVLPPDNFWIGIAKVSNLNEVSPWIVDTGFNKVEVDLAGTPTFINNIANAAFGGTHTVTNVSGNIWKIETLINASYIQNNESYIMVLGVKRPAPDLYENSFATSIYEANESAGISTGIMTAQSYVYDVNTTLLNKSCLINNAIHSRWKPGVMVLKESYDNEIFTAGKAGSFDTNFDKAEAYIMDAPPTSTTVFPIANLINVLYDDNGTEFWAYSDNFITPATWADTTKYIVFRFIYYIGGAGGDEEVVLFPLKVYTKGFTTTDLTNSSLVYEGTADPVGSILCTDDDRDIEAIITKTAAGDASLIAIREISIQEEDAYTNDQITQLQNDVLEVTDFSIAPANDGTILIDTSELSSSEECIRALTIPTDLPGTEPVCDCYNAFVLQRTESCNGTVCNIYYSVSTGGTPAGDVVYLTMDAVINGQSFTRTETGVAFFTGTVQVPEDLTITGSYNIQLQMANGCYYEWDFVFNTLNTPASQDSDTTQDCPCNTCFTWGNISTAYSMTNINIQKPDGTLTTLSAEGVGAWPVDFSVQAEIDALEAAIQLYVDTLGGGDIMFFDYDSIFQLQFNNSCVKFLSFESTGSLAIPSQLFGSCQYCNYTLTYGNSFIDQVYLAAQGSDVSFALPNDPYANDQAGALALETDLQAYWDLQGINGVFDVFFDGANTTINLTGSSRQLTRVRIDGITFQDFVQTCFY